MSNFGLFSFIFQEILLPYNLRRGKTHPTHIDTHPAHIRHTSDRKQAVVLCVDQKDSLRDEGKTLEGIFDGRTWTITLNQHSCPLCQASL